MARLADAVSEFIDAPELIELRPLPRSRPRLKLRDKLWECETHYPFVCGYGYTPLQAFEEWLTLKARLLAVDR
jgi:hypothetical protein